MDREQEEMQFLGVFGIYKEAYKVILTWRKIFSQITLALILPLSFIFLAHMEVSNLLFSKIIHTDRELDHTREGTENYHKLLQLISKERTYFWLFEALQRSEFQQGVECCPKGNTVLGFPTLFVILISYLVGFIYMTIIWHLASVVSVLEESCGFGAVVKSHGLIKGKWGVAIVVFFKLNISLVIIERVFQALVVRGWSLGMVNRVSYGIVCFLLLFKLILFGLVIQTVIYFVCKSYHHENIDKSALSDHLEVYDLGEYVPLKAKDVQLEHYDRV
ncbi:hypothetical protein QYF36_016755 [Acer negundo]|nr:hypothetical protein QYF36_016755 [Acer negundo]